MTQNVRLVIFVDALPWESIHLIKEKINYLDYYKMRPTLGYSINLKAELLGGYTPDNAGFFCEWSYHRDSPYEKKLRLMRQIFSILTPLHSKVDGLLHKIFNRFNNEDIFRIPFKFLPYFAKQGTEAYRDEFHLPTVLSELGFSKSIYSDFSGPMRDELALEHLIEQISSKTSNNYFAAFAEVDHKTHDYGVRSTKHTELIREYSDHIHKILVHFKGIYPEGEVLIFSDHGMSNPDQLISLDFESNIGRPGLNSYIYFVDATMVRIWIFDQTLEEGIVSYLKSFESGEILDNEQRRKYNVSNEDFGDIIFVLDDTAIFNPNFFGSKAPLGMHGYLPENDSQLGVVISNIPLDCSPGDELSPTDIHHILGNRKL